jgi:hypothetical protein
VISDLRGGMPALINGSVWCRMVDDDTYRLHATDLNADATRLQWTGVHLALGYGVTVQAALAIEESLPVRAVLAIAGSNGATIRSQHIFDTTAKQSLAVPGLSRLANPLTVTLHVQPLRSLKMGERAVIDISSVTGVPSEANPALSR